LVISQSSWVNEERLSKLWRAHVVLGTLHGVTAIILAGLASTKQIHNTIPWYSHLPLPRPSDEHPVAWAPDPKKQASVPVGAFSAIFIALAALNHLVTATFMWSSYTQNLRFRRNPIRWFEYSFSASLMHVHVAMLSGVMDVHLCFLIFGLTMTTMMCGYLAEPSASPTSKPHMRAFWAGFVPWFYQWLVIACYFFYSLTKGDPPKWVYSIWFIILCLDLSFAINMFFQLKEWSWWSDYIHAELGYCLLSLTAKQLLAWINYGGTASLPPNP